MSRSQPSATTYRPLKHLEQGLLISPDAGWAAFRLRTHQYDLESLEGRRSRLYRLVHLLDKLVGYEGHLIVTSRSFPVAERLKALDDRTSRPTEGWSAHLDRMYEGLRGQQLHSREVYLLVRLGDVGREGWGNLLLNGIPRLLQLEDPRSPVAEVETLKVEAEMLLNRLETPGLGLRMATAAELRWLVARTVRRGRLENTEVPMPPNRPAWGGELHALIDDMAEDAGRHIVLGDELAGYGYVATLSFAHMPPRGLQFPGQADWCHAILAQDFPVEVSMRFKVLRASDAIKDVQGAIKAADDTLEHTAKLRMPDPRGIAERRAEAEELEHEIQREQQSLIHVWPRLVVAAPTPEALAARCARTISQFSDSSIVLTRSAGDQWPLFLESIPGDRTRGSYEHKLPAETLAGTMPTACDELGDGEGPYIGVTMGLGRTPVLYDPLRAARVNKPTGVAFVGSPGGGKSVSALAMAAMARLGGATVLYVDPYFGASKLNGIPGLGQTQTVRLDASFPGVLDPWGIETNPQEASQLAAEIVRAFLPPHLSHQVYGNLLAAAGAESGARRPRLQGMVDRLGESQNPSAREAAETLREMMKWPLASLCFAQNEATPLNVDGKLTIMQLSNLKLPRSGTSPNDYGVAELLSVGVMLAVVALAQKLLRSGGPNQPKLLGVDECWFLTGSAYGRRVLEEVARSGRKYNTALLLASQTSRDFADEAVLNCLSSIFVFKSEAAEEIERECRLLGIEHSPMVATLIKDELEPGECLYRDPDGRVGRMYFDPTPEWLEILGTTPGEQERGAA